MRMARNPTAYIIVFKELRVTNAYILIPPRGSYHNIQTRQGRKGELVSWIASQPLHQQWTQEASNFFFFSVLNYICVSHILHLHASVCMYWETVSSGSCEQKGEKRNYNGPIGSNLSLSWFGNSGNWESTHLKFAEGEQHYHSPTQIPWGYYFSLQSPARFRPCLYFFPNFCPPANLFLLYSLFRGILLTNKNPKPSR